MPGDRLSAAAAVVAYQTNTLTELRGLFDQIDFDFRDALEREIRISDTLDRVGSDFDAARALLQSMGVNIPVPQPRSSTVTDLSLEPPSHPRYSIPIVPTDDDFRQLVTLAEARLDLLGIDLSRDPLVQVLPSSQIARSLRNYADEHGDIGWDKADWTVVLLAGALATLLDVILVRIPKDSAFLSKTDAGSPLKEWLQGRERAQELYGRFVSGLENLAKVARDAPHARNADDLVSGVWPKTHRLESLGDDPAVGFLFGVADLMHRIGSYIDITGPLAKVSNVADSIDLIEDLITHMRQLFSEVYTPAGPHPPFFSLLQLDDIDSPLTSGPSGIKASWTDVARYMYANGYDLRQFFAMGLTPGVVSAIICGYWLLNSYATGGTAAQRKLEQAKLNSMLLLGHTIATSGTLLKTGLLFRMNPAALNYNQILAMAPVTIAWFKEAVARDERINEALDKEWEVLLTESEGQS